MNRPLPLPLNIIASHILTLIDIHDSKVLGSTALSGIAGTRNITLRRIDLSSLFLNVIATLADLAGYRIVPVSITGLRTVLMPVVPVALKESEMISEEDLLLGILEAPVEGEGVAGTVICRDVLTAERGLIACVSLSWLAVHCTSVAIICLACRGTDIDIQKCCTSWVDVSRRRHRLQ